MEKFDKDKFPESTPPGLVPNERLDTGSRKNHGDLDSQPKGSYFSESSISTDDISLKEIVLKVQELSGFLLSKWSTILIAGLLGGILGFIYTYSQKPAYKAELSFALEEEKSGGMGGALGIASQFGFDLGGGGGGAFAGDNLFQLMKSRSMVEKVLLSTVTIEGKNQTLAEFYISFNKLREGWKGKAELDDILYLPNADRSKFTLKQDSVLGQFYRTIISGPLTVDKLDKKSSIILVRFISENELFAKYFTEKLAKEVSDFYVDTKTKKSVQNLKILQHQTDSVRRALYSALGGMASSIDANPNVNPARQKLLVPSQTRQVDVEANTVILGELVKNLEISKVSLRRETPLIQIIDTPILPLPQEKMSKRNGIIFTGLAFGIVSIIYLLLARFLKEIL
ncbi:MAG: lipopolysaccharide biosynthesis protein [Daejeonella sp.]|uniref:lipopolysaccharide biosynthesis protein n=1 Tax=Daejeonella sp. TaxID=2805397 RepID=UPI0027346926|nr:lipopolysaccharide biosynthesis protein [Daejeonella sp.]MDP3467542.1 lipopolysaccharide biosynthesis protein [Daejeonella sp.]